MRVLGDSRVCVVCAGDTGVRVLGVSRCNRPWEFVYIMEIRGNYMNFHCFGPYPPAKNSKIMKIIFTPHNPILYTICRTATGSDGVM